MRVLEHSYVWPSHAQPCIVLDDFETMRMSTGDHRDLSSEVNGFKIIMEAFDNFLAFSDDRVVKERKFGAGGREGREEEKGEETGEGRERRRKEGKTRERFEK